LSGADHSLRLSGRRGGVLSNIKALVYVDAYIPDQNDTIGTNDKIIPEAEQAAMAKTAGARTQKFSASHLGIMSQPATVTKFIEQAVRSVR
jgi:hypothetical protein